MLAAPAGNGTTGGDGGTAGTGGAGGASFGAVMPATAAPEASAATVGAL
ncbi:hypothetical protein [Mycobacterium riyadhense]|nr:hypothetical protein [Mycobacterium riyadhense]